jgi:uncharacterized protein YbjT (DUF2867 family)
MRPAGRRTRVLLVGGGGGFVGRQLLPLLAREYLIRSVHRHPVPVERVTHVEWIAADVGTVTDWRPILQDVEVVVNLAWYRWGPPAKFRQLCRGLERLLAAATEAGVERFLHVSVPPAPDRMELELPYLRWKRQFDRALEASGLSHAIVRPTLLFGPGDVLLTVMLRTIQRYPFFPMFGDGGYRLNPLSVGDLAQLLQGLTTSPRSGIINVGGPEVFRYRDLTDLIFRVAGKRPRYWSMSERNGIRLAGLLQSLGSTKLYAYEVEWLVSDRLVQPTWIPPGGSLQRVEPYLRRLAAGVVDSSSGMPAGGVENGTD